MSWFQPVWSLLDYMTGADLLPGAAGAATPSATPRADVAAAGATPQKRQQQRRKPSRSPCEAAAKYAAIVTIPPGVVPGQAMQVQLADGRCVVVQVPSGAAAGQQLRIAEETPKDAVGEASGRSEDDTEGVGGAPSDSEADLAMGADERWVRDAAESMALEKLRGVLGEAARCSDEMQSLAQSIGSEARCFLRYLRLHSMDADKAAAGIHATLAFRAKFRVESAEAELKESGVMDRIVPHWCCALGSTAPDGSPVLYWHAAKLDAQAMFKHVDESQFTQFFCFWMERGLAAQRASIRRGLKPAGVIEIYDLSGVSLYALGSASTRMFGRVLGLGQQHYPENLTKGYLINAPWFFTRGYDMVKPMLNASTVEQLEIFSDDAADALRELMDSEDLRRLRSPEMIASSFASEP